MKRVAPTLSAAVIVAAGAVGPASMAYARSAHTHATSVTATITCGSGSSGAVSLTPVNKRDMATGAPLSVGCGQFSPGTLTESVSRGTVSYNYSGDYYLIGASTATPCGPGAAKLGTAFSCSSGGASITFSLAAS